MPADVRVCKFLRRAESKERRLVSGPGVHICERCVELAVEILDKTDEDES